MGWVDVIAVDAIFNKFAPFATHPMEYVPERKNPVPDSCENASDGDPREPLGI